MEWCFETCGGAVRVRQEGDRASCQALRAMTGEGLYKAWLLGQGGRRFLLGTLIPEGGALKLRRSVTLTQLREKGVWPPTGAEIAMAYRLTPAEGDRETRQGKCPYRQELPQGFCWENCPGRLTEDRVLRRALERLGCVALREEGEGHCLAVPFEPDKPFPLPPIFCLAQVRELEGRPCLLFFLDREGRPGL